MLLIIIIQFGSAHKVGYALICRVLAYFPLNLKNLAERGREGTS